MEERVWEGGPSQLVNLGGYIICALTFWLIVPVFIALWNWLEIKCTRYILTTERLQISTGVFTRHLEEIELYRVKDSALTEPFLYRLFGLAVVDVTTSDYSASYLRLKGIKDGEAVRDLLRTHVEACRRRQRVRDVDVSDMHHF